MGTLLSDLRYGLRTLLKTPSMAAIGVLTIALAIGANTAIFSVVNAVLLRPLPYADSGRLVTLLHPSRSASATGSSPASPPDFLDWQRQATTIETMGAAEAWGASYQGSDVPEQITGMRLSGEMFPLLGVPAQLGTTFGPSEAQPGKNKVVVLGHGLWQRRFGGDPRVLGRTMILNNESYTILGVMPEHFRFAPFWITNAELWIPMRVLDDPSLRLRRSLRVFGRLKPGVTIEQAQSEMATIAAALASAYPDSNAKLTVKVDPLHEQAVGSLRLALLALWGAVGLVLLIACANVANLLLARSAARSREIAVRTALGASRIRIVRQLLSESALLALAGGIIGIATAFWGVEALKAFMRSGGSQFARVAEISVDPLVLLFSFAVTLTTGLLAGLLPAFQMSRTDAGEALKDASRGTSHGRRRHRTLGALVAVETALAVILLVGAGLMLRTFFNLASVRPGFDPNNVLTFTMSVAGLPQYTGESRALFYREALDQFRAIPGVRSAAYTNHLPLGGDTWGFRVNVEGRPVPRPGEEIGAIYRVSSPGYFDTMGSRIVRGRDFNDSDTLSTQPVAIINSALANQLWPGEDPIGRRFNTRDPQKPVWLTVVGVVEDIRQRQLATPGESEFYIPLAQNEAMFASTQSFSSYLTVVIRTAGDPMGAAGAVKARLAAIDRKIALSQLQTLEEVIEAKTWRPRFHLLLFGLFAALALVLATAGVYGVMAYTVAQQTRDVGIRMALGARQSSVLALMLRQGMTRVMAGALAGLGGAFATTRMLSNMLYGVAPFDPATFASVSLLLLATALLAVLAPARRATRVDPAIALRGE